MGLSEKELGGFGAGPGVGFADLAGSAGKVGFRVDEIAVEHEFGAAVVERVALLPNHSDWILDDELINANDGDCFNLALCHQETIEGVSM